MKKLVAGGKDSKRRSEEVRGLVSFSSVNYFTGNHTLLAQLETVLSSVLVTSSLGTNPALL